MLAASLVAGISTFGCSPGGSDEGPAAGSGGARAGSGGRSGTGGGAPGTGGSSTSGSGGSAAAGGSGGAGTGGGGTGGTGTGGASGGGSGSDAAPVATDGGAGGAMGQPIADGLTQLLVSRGIGLGYYHACHVLDTTQKVKCFGTADPRNRPPADVTAAKVDQIACAHNGCCALLPPGGAGGKRLSCWSHKATFYPPNGGANLDPIHFGIGYDHGCALNKDSSVVCWGSGKGPQNSAPAGLKAKSLAIATFFNCAVLMDDSVQCWGAIDRNPPTPVKAKLVAAINHDNTRADMDDITKSTGHVCAILMDDTLKCWGDNIEGTTDVPASLGKVRDVAAATWNTCAVKLDGEVVCWGTKKYNASPERYHPQPEGIRLKGIRAKLATYCGLKMDNTLACWGDESNVHITIEPPTQKFWSP
jgi:hypothetical protein